MIIAFARHQGDQALRPFEFDPGGQQPLARHQVWIVGPPERPRIRRAELGEMKTVEDLAAGGDPVGF